VIDVAIVGAGPCGLAAAISARRAGLDAVVFDEACVVSSITQYPTYATFFSTAEKLSLGGLPFVTTGEKPSRRDALAYYRTVVRYFEIPVRQYERVTRIDRSENGFVVRTSHRGVERTTDARAVIVATGYWGSPNRIGVPGEDLPHVTHAFREGHYAFQQNAVVVGGGNSAAEAALDLWRSGAKVTLVHIFPAFDKKIKPWVLPDFDNRVKEGSIAARWSTKITAIKSNVVVVQSPEGEDRIPADLVYVMTGFAPNVKLLDRIGVPIDPVTGIPKHDPETLETSVPGLFIAGVVIAGFDANKVFIENGRYHGDKIVAALQGTQAPPPPKLSPELDT
jgi:thioredoxin reductase (NADPH)